MGEQDSLEQRVKKLEQEKADITRKYNRLKEDYGLLADRHNGVLQKDKGFITYMADSIQEPLVATDEEGTITLFNSGAESLFGVGRDKALQTPFTDLLMREEDQKSYTAFVMQHPLSADPSLAAPVELLAKGRDEQQKTLEMSLTRFGVAPYTHLLLLRDISKRKAFEAAL